MSLCMFDERAIQGIAPSRVEVCGDLATFANAVWRCASAGEVIADYGMGHRGLGARPPAGHVQIDPPAGVIEHYVPDMAVRVAAGTKLGDLQTALAGQRQFLPIDGHPAMTIGEIVTHNVSGALRIGSGSVRDLLLGLRYIDSEGQVITVGGRTVKNVAGYDVTRLMVGSLNMLGLPVEVTLRTAAVPPQVTQVEVDAVDPVAFSEAMTDLLVSEAAPWSLEWEHVNTMGQLRPNVLRFGYAGTMLTCRTQVRALRDWFQRHDWWLGGDLPARDVTPAQDQQERAARWAWRQSATVVGKLIVPPAATGKFIDVLLHLEVPPPMVQALPSHGIIHFGAGWPVDRTLEIDELLLEKLRQVEGMRVWLRRPAHDLRIAPFAPEQPDWALLVRLKQAMDPSGLFNPERFP